MQLSVTVSQAKCVLIVLVLVYLFKDFLGYKQEDKYDVARSSEWNTTDDKTVFLKVHRVSHVNKVSAVYLPRSFFLSIINRAECYSPST